MKKAKFMNEYLEDGVTCPYCGEQNSIESLEQPQVNETYVSLLVICINDEKCGVSFEEIYELKKIKAV